MSKKKTVKQSISTFKWQPEGSLGWILDCPREKFERKVQLMPLCVLLEEYGYLREAQEQVQLQAYAEWQYRAVRYVYGIWILI